MRNYEENKIESEAKGTSTINEAQTSSVQTQSIENANVGINACNIVDNHDQCSNTESAQLADKANQQEIKLVDLALDPLKSSVNDQAVGEYSINEEDKEEQNKDITVNEERLREIIQEQLNLMKATILEECQNYISHKISEKEQNNILKMSVHQVRCHL